MKEIWAGLDWNFLFNILKAVIPALVCITLHELAHGFVAYKLGDNTAKEAGRLTLNPIKHIDIMGLFMMLIFRFGWAKPVPVNMNNFNNPKRGMAITAMAGPLANLAIAAFSLILFGVFYRLRFSGGTIVGTAVDMLGTTAYLSIAFAVFNILPIPPLDGSKVLFSLSSDKTYYNLMRYERYGIIFLMLLLFVLNRTGINPIGAIASWIFDKMFILTELAFSAVGKMY